MASSWFPLFGRDFLAATTGWTADERGHYITLLIVQWEQGGLPDDVKRLELISPGVKASWGTVSEKFPVWKDGKRRNTRLEHERSKSHERSERARQSASQRWAQDAGHSGDQCKPASCPDCHGGCVGTCERTCERISDRICPEACSDDASISMSYSPPPPAGANDTGEAWGRLREAWNTGAESGRREPWRSGSPPDKAKARLAEPGWIEEAMRAVEMTGELKAFEKPVTLGQFCQEGWVAKILGGYWREKPKPRGRRGEPLDAPPPPRVDPAFAAAREATLAREARRRAEEHARLDRGGITGGA